jgi:hypothetical protein
VIPCSFVPELAVRDRIQPKRAQLLLDPSKIWPSRLSSSATRAPSDVDGQDARPLLLLLIAVLVLNNEVQGASFKDESSSARPVHHQIRSVARLVCSFA